MRNWLKTVLSVIAFIPFLKGNPLDLNHEPNLCEDWVTYRDEKCLAILTKAGPSTQEEAENACGSLPRSNSRIVTVRTKEQHDFLHRYLYRNEMSASVWLGLKANNNSQEFEWYDGSELTFNNWVTPTVSGPDRQCVEINEAGLWVAVSCTKKNMVICERESVWVTGALDNGQPQANATALLRKVDPSEEDCEKEIVKSEKKIDLLKKATDKTFDLLKEAKERFADLLQSEEPNTALTNQQHRRQGGSLVTSNQQKLCGDWTAYEDKKCFKIADQAGFQTKEDAEVVCQAFSQEVNRDSAPKLITITSKDEQEFLQHFLFVENELLDNVWLGLSRKGNGSFEWNDGIEMSFNNWASQTLPDDQHDCVQMESGDGSFQVGLWVRVSCKRKYAVVCERKPTWTLETLQNALLSFRWEHEMRQKEWEQKQNEWERKFTKSGKEQETAERDWDEKFSKSQLSVIELKQRNQVFAQKLAMLTKTTVPVGFIYVQLPDQLPPLLLWPSTNWTDVSDHYAGLFFRVIGGNAAPFGQVQEANTSRLEQVQRNTGSSPNLITVPTDGSWSVIVDSGGPSGNNNNALKFRLSSSEIRPRNQAVRIWKRVE